MTAPARVSQLELAVLGLLGSQRGVGSHRVEEPCAEPGRGLDHTTAYEDGVGIGEVGGLRSHIDLISDMV